ncbi:MAG: hypothetical protein H8E10_15575 [Desulfobacterales bacterium]|nr:hypothetical protein [Desulfobacterales bacterium]MBL7173600.1 hypothetical protein [Desulfobacteraceae bacterium]MBL7205730.1 hypothetical protein [Desulfobacteraceae bacterium]
MSGKDSFLLDEQKNIEKTVAMIEDLSSKTDLSKYEVIALGTLLQNLYTGIEGILRYQLQNRGVKLQKDENWHKDLLIKSRERGLVSDAQFEGLLELLLFRHMHIHGYGFMLNEKRLRQLAAPVPSLCQSFLSSL